MRGHIVVTGASGAIGGAIARALRRRHSSARFTLLDVPSDASETLARALGGDAVVRRCDLACTDGARRVLDEARDHFGPVHGLVNCAGIMEVRRFERLPWDRAAALLSIDLVSPLALMHAVVPEMVAARRGFVVNVTSMAGKVTLPGCAFYGAAKAGLSMASEIARGELAASGVHVLTVYPGAVQSPLESRARDQYGRALLARLAPTGKPDVLAAKVIEALDARRPRVVYPSLYALGLLTVASPLALAVGPRAVD
jgi:3-hydroxybutyrate dehydrogenase